jgi:8-oxo-dGTP pyrophosphatase MutT (NUDIX family)
MMERSKESFEIKLKAGIVILHKGKVLLIKEKNNRTGKYAWNIVKGTFEPGRDKSIEATAIRESMEEAGAKIKLKYLLGTYYLQDGKNALMMFTFIADLLNRTNVGIAPKEAQASYREGEDIVETRFFTRSELKKLKPKDFVGLRGYLAVKDYLDGRKLPLSALKTLAPK